MLFDVNPKSNYSSELNIWDSKWPSWLNNSEVNQLCLCYCSFNINAVLFLFMILTSFHFHKKNCNFFLVDSLFKHNIFVLHVLCTCSIIFMSKGVISVMKYFRLISILVWFLMSGINLFVLFASYMYQYCSYMILKVYKDKKIRVIFL